MFGPNSFSGFEFPAYRAAGFDPTHPAGGSLVRMSCVPAGGGAFINLLNGQASTPTNGTFTSPIWGALGPTVTVPGTSTAYNSVANSISESPTATTVAAIFAMNGASLNGYLVSDETSASATINALKLSSGEAELLLNDAVTVVITPALTTKVPYFVAISGKVNLQYYVIVNLLTGQVIASGSGSATHAPGTNSGAAYAIGGVSTASQTPNVWIAAAMMSRQFLSLDQLLAWGQDPWAFWYPSDAVDLLGAGLGRVAMVARSSAFGMAYSVLGQGVISNFFKFNLTVDDWLKAKDNLASDSVKILLTNTAPVASNHLYTDISAGELASGNGYTTGGKAVTASLSNVSGLETLSVSGSLTWTSSLGSMGPFRYVVVYDATSGYLLGYWDYGQSLTLNGIAGDSFVWNPGSNTVFTLQ
jgi:hypothetical protein